VPSGDYMCMHKVEMPHLNTSHVAYCYYLERGGQVSVAENLLREKELIRVYNLGERLMPGGMSHYGKSSRKMMALNSPMMGTAHYHSGGGSSGQAEQQLDGLVLFDACSYNNEAMCLQLKQTFLVQSIPFIIFQALDMTEKLNDGFKSLKAIYQSLCAKDAEYKTIFENVGLEISLFAASFLSYQQMCWIFFCLFLIIVFEREFRTAHSKFGHATIPRRERQSKGALAKDFLLLVQVRACIFEAERSGLVLVSTRGLL
jgi:hypothetical protein